MNNGKARAQAMNFSHHRESFFVCLLFAELSFSKSETIFLVHDKCLEIIHHFFIAEKICQCYSWKALVKHLLNEKKQLSENERASNEF